MRGVDPPELHSGERELGSQGNGRQAFRAVKRDWAVRAVVCEGREGKGGSYPAGERAPRSRALRVEGRCKGVGSARR